MFTQNRQTVTDGYQANHVFNEDVILTYFAKHFCNVIYKCKKLSRQLVNNRNDCDMVLNTVSHSHR